MFVGALLFSASCQRQGVLYDMPTDSAVVSFPSEDAIFTMTKEDGNKITVQLNRGNTKGAVSIPFTFTDGTDGVFKPAKNSFDFADGEGVAYVDIKYDDINNLGGGVYEMELEVPGDQVSPSGIATLAVSAQRLLTPKFIGTGVFYSLSLFEQSWEQDIYNTEEAPDFYILPDCYAEGYNVTFSYKSGEFVFPEMIDTGVMYDPDTPAYGTFALHTISGALSDGVLYITCGFALPAIPYSFGTGFMEAYQLPAGFTF